MALLAEMMEDADKLGFGHSVVSVCCDPNCHRRYYRIVHSSNEAKTFVPGESIVYRVPKPEPLRSMIYNRGFDNEREDDEYTNRRAKRLRRTAERDAGLGRKRGPRP